MYSGSYSGLPHSRLAQITPANGGHLVPRRLSQFSGTTEKLETTPVVRVFASGSTGAAGQGEHVGCESRLLKV